MKFKIAILAAALIGCASASAGTQTKVVTTRTVTTKSSYPPPAPCPKLARATVVVAHPVRCAPVVVHRRVVVAPCRPIHRHTAVVVRVR